MTSTSTSKGTRNSHQFKPAPVILFVACLLVTASLWVTTDAGYETYAGFPFHFVTFYNYPVTDPPVDFWGRFAPQWNANGMVFANIFWYYMLIVAVRKAIKDLGRRRRGLP